jgi:hypothetical protein
LRYKLYYGYFFYSIYIRLKAKVVAIDSDVIAEVSNLHQIESLTS